MHLVKNLMTAVSRIDYSGKKRESAAERMQSERKACKERKIGMFIEIDRRSSTAGVTEREFKLS